jgi:hypothetical protein
MNNPADIERIKQEVDFAPTLDFEPSSEPWVNIKVEDGAELRFKSVIKQVKRISDDPNTLEPRYFVGSEHIVRISKKPMPEGMER